MEEGKRIISDKLSVRMREFCRKQGHESKILVGTLGLILKSLERMCFFTFFFNHLIIVHNLYWEILASKDRAKYKYIGKTFTGKLWPDHPKLGEPPASLISLPIYKL